MAFYWETSNVQTCVLAFDPFLHAGGGECFRLG